MLAKSIAESINPLAGELDDGIALLVVAMREQGFDTISSCEGHFRSDEFRHAKPNVVFIALDRALLHSWIREVSRTAAPEILPAGFSMFPVWSPERDVVHEDNWIVEIDVSECATADEARSRANQTVKHLVTTLEAATRCRPIATDTFVRSRW